MASGTPDVKLNVALIQMRPKVGSPYTVMHSNVLSILHRAVPDILLTTSAP